MLSSSRWRWPALFLALGSVVLLAAGQNHGQDRPAGQATPADLNQSLRHVINVGAELFNKQADYAGCYHVYEGALIAVRPLVSPELQQKITEGLERAERMPQFSDRAFELRRVIDEVRVHAKKGTATERPPVVEVKDKKEAPPIKLPEKKLPEKKLPEKKVEPKKVPEIKPPEKKVPEKKVEPKKVPEKKVEKKVPEKKVEEKKVEKKDAKADAKAGQVAGVVTFNGQPLSGGFFVTLVSKDGRKFSTLVKDGQFNFTKAVPPGEYRVAFEPAPGADAKLVQRLPARYRAEATSGIVVRVQPGKQQMDLHLVP